MIYKAVAETISLLEIILPMMLLGMLIAHIIYSLPHFRKINDLIQSIASFANLKCGIAVAAFFVHQATALSILADMYKKRVIDEIEVIIASIIGLLPMSIRTALFLIAPIAIPTLGIRPGTIYVLLEILSKAFIAFIGVYLGRRYLRGDTLISHNVSPERDLLDVVRQFLRVTVVLAPSIFVTTALLDYGLNSVVTALRESQLLIVISGTGSTIAGLGVAGSLLSKGEINEEEALILLVVASAFHRIVEGLRFSLPLRLSLFGKFGFKLTLITIFANVSSSLFSLAFLLLSGKDF